MPKINWEEFAEIKHSVSQARTVLCSAWLRLEKLKFKSKWKDDTISKLKQLGVRLEAFEDYLHNLILKHSAEKM